MPKKLQISCLLFLFFLATISVNAEIPTISLLTCGSGDELQNTFGHSGIRITHLQSKYDVVYGYGTYDFSQPNFYANFCRGKLMYYVNVLHFDRFMNEYNHFKRSVTEQVLNLDSIQTFQMIEFLENNAKEENRFYKYDFFWDNCATRIRDIIEVEYDEEWPSIEKDNATLGDILIPVGSPKGIESKTYRDLLDEKLVPLVWSDFGIDLVIGAVADDVADYRNQMYLPDYLMQMFARAKVDGKPLVKETKKLLIFDEVQKERWKVPFVTPLKVMLAFLFLVLVWTLLNNPTSIKFLNVTGLIWYFLMSLICLVIIFLWFFTDHLATKENWNLIWISPFFISGLLRYRSLTKVKRLQYIPIAIIILNVSALMLWNFIPQRFHIAFLPMMAISILLAANQLRVNISKNGWFLA